MKKFLVFLMVIGGAAAAYWFYDPYLKPHVEPLIDKVVGKGPSEESTPTTPSGDTPSSPALPLSKTDSPSAPTPASGAAATAATKAPGEAPASVPAPEMSEVDRIVAERYPMPTFVPLVQIVGNWATIPERAFPAEVEIRDRVPFSLRDSSGKVIGASVAVPGTLVKPLRLDGETLQVASLANSSMRSEIDVSKTDLRERIERRYNDFIVNMTKQVRDQRERAKRALLARPETLAAITGGAAAFDESGDPRFAPVKASLAANAVKAFSLQEAVAFRWNGSEQINGDIYKGTFDTVTVKYEARTIFGVFPGEAKCLLQNGNVIGWVDPITEEEMI